MSYRYRFYPTAKQESLLTWWMATCCTIYNAALQERKASLQWRRRGWREKHVSYEDQTRSLTEIRAADPAIRAVPSDVLRSALQRVNETDQYMFAAWKAGRRFRSRYKPRDQYTSFTYPAPKRLLRHDGTSRNAVVRLPGAGGWAKIRYHREMQGTPKRVSVTRAGDVWHIVILCEVDTQAPSPIDASTVAPDRIVGIDVGIKSLAALSNGEIVDNPRFGRKGQRKLAERQRQLARKKKGSKSRARQKELVRRAYCHIAEQRKQHAHKVANALVRRFDVIAHEDLVVARMVHGNLAKHIYDARWSMLLNVIAFKAESAGKRTVSVRAHGTSQECSGCGETVPKSLSVRWHKCKCGVSLDRDVNAAKVILARGLEALCASEDKHAAATSAASPRRSTRGKRITAAQSS